VHPAAGAGAGFRRLSGRRGLSPSGDWDSGNPAFAISRGSPGTPSRTPRQRPPVSWHAIVPGSSFRNTGQPSDPKTPPPVHARYAGYIAVRLVAHTERPVPAHTVDVLRSYRGRSGCRAGEPHCVLMAATGAKPTRRFDGLFVRPRASAREHCCADHQQHGDFALTADLPPRAIGRRQGPAGHPRALRGPMSIIACRGQWADPARVCVVVRI
jgi:hypothetical protein